jgi:hypothetical protein
MPSEILSAPDRAKIWSQLSEQQQLVFDKYIMNGLERILFGRIIEGNGNRWRLVNVNIDYAWEVRKQSIAKHIPPLRCYCGRPLKYQFELHSLSNKGRLSDNTRLLLGYACFADHAGIRQSDAAKLRTSVVTAQQRMDYTLKWYKTGHRFPNQIPLEVINSDIMKDDPDFQEKIRDFKSADFPLSPKDESKLRDYTTRYQAKKAQSSSIKSPKKPTTSTKSNFAKQLTIQKYRDFCISELEIINESAENLLAKVPQGDSFEWYWSQYHMVHSSILKLLKSGNISKDSANGLSELSEHIPAIKARSITNQLDYILDHLMRIEALIWTNSLPLFKKVDYLKAINRVALFSSRHIVYPVILKPSKRGRTDKQYKRILLQIAQQKEKQLHKRQQQDIRYQKVFEQIKRLNNDSITENVATRIINMYRRLPRGKSADIEALEQLMLQIQNS